MAASLLATAAAYEDDHVLSDRDTTFDGDLKVSFDVSLYPSLDTHSLTHSLTHSPCSDSFTEDIGHESLH
jgi:hypothetical protein